MILSPAPPLPNSAAGCTLLASTWVPLGGLHPALPDPIPILSPSPILHPNPCFDHQAAPGAPSPWACYIMDSLHTSGQTTCFSWKMFSCLHLSKPSGMFKTKLKAASSEEVPLYQPGGMGTGPHFCSHSTWFIHLLTKPSFSLLLLLFTDFFPSTPWCPKD